jgi:hypothetical protein
MKRALLSGLLITIVACGNPDGTTLLTLKNSIGQAAGAIRGGKGVVEVIFTPPDAGGRLVLLPARFRVPEGRFRPAVREDIERKLAGSEEAHSFYLLRGKLVDHQTLPKGVKVVPYLDGQEGTATQMQVLPARDGSQTVYVYVPQVSH